MVREVSVEPVGRGELLVEGRGALLQEMVLAAAGGGDNGVGGDESDASAGAGGIGITHAGGNGGDAQLVQGNGNAGLLPGGGGSGGHDLTIFYTCSDGGAGADGQVVITYTVNLTPTITSFTPSGGCANTTPVVITGTNFTGATSVTFGGTNAASFTVNSSTQITATPGAGTTGTIQVTTAGGTATSAGTFTVNPSYRH